MRELGEDLWYDSSIFYTRYFQNIGPDTVQETYITCSELSSRKIIGAREMLHKISTLAVAFL